MEVVTVHVQFPRDEVDDLDAEARLQKRSRTNMVRVGVADYLQRRRSTDEREDGRDG